MLCGVICNIDVQTSSQQKITNIYEYVKYNFVVCTIGNLLFRKETLGRLFTVQKTFDEGKKTTL